MKVICSSTCINDQEEKTEDYWLTIGKSYPVLGIFGRNDEIYYRIIADDRSVPALHKANLFDGGKFDIPREWVFIIRKDSEWECIPKSFAQEGFWERFYDGDEFSLAVFRREIDLIERHDNI